MTAASARITELVLPFGGSYICANFGENRSRNATVRVLADGQIYTDTYTDTLKPCYNLSHAICYSYGTDNKRSNAKISVQSDIRT